MKRNVLLIGAAALVAIIALWYFVLYAPLGDDLTSAQAQTAAEQKKTDGLQADLARLQSQEKNGTQQQALLRKLNAAVPEQPDLAEFIIQANQIASDSGISFLSISPSPPAAGSNGVSVISLTITIKGSFFQLEDYLRQLETLERLVIVDGITISASSGGGSSTTGTDTSTDSSTSSGGTDLSVTLTGRMFTRAAAPAADGSTAAPGDSTTTTTTPAGATTPSTTPATSSPSTGGV